MPRRDSRPPPGGGGEPPPPLPPTDTLADDTDPWSVFLGAGPQTAATLAACMQYLSSPSGLEELTTFAEQDATTYELGMARFAVVARRRVKALREVVAERLAVRREKSTPPRTLAEELGDLAPDGVDTLIVPFGYRLDRTGTWRSAADGTSPSTRVAGGPVVILGEEEDTVTNTRHLRLGWLRPDGDWASVRASRGIAADPSSIVRLAGNGAPWNALEARDVVKYITAFERTNQHTLPRIETTSHMGWHARGDVPSFVLPGRVIGPAKLDLAPDEGMKAHLGGWTVRGAWEDWLSILPHLAPYPLALTGIYASLAAPLIWALHATPFVVDFSGVTSGGKSTTLRLAASVWGSPLEGDGVFHSWGDTSVHVELYAGLLHSLPVILDDTKSFRGGAGARVPGDFVYLFAQGRGRGRGLKAGGVSPAATWRTVLLSSGEAPLAGYGRDAGVYARTVHVRGRPFGDDEARGNEMSKWINAMTALNHGHAGERWVTWLCANAPQWVALVDRWRALDARLGADAPGRIAGRLAGYLALLRLTEELAAEVLGIPDTGAIDHVVASVYARAVEEDVPMGAYELAMNWSVSNVSRFWPRSDAAPTQGWAGRWDAGAEWVWLIPTVLEKVLEASSGRLDEVEETWVLRGLARARSVVDVAGNSATCVGLRVNMTAPMTDAGVG